MTNVNKKILWISDYDLDTAPGGAQRSDKILIDHGKISGFNILKTNHQSIKDISSFDSFDTVISSNLAHIYYENKQIIDKICSHRNHVRIEHDSNHYLSNQDRARLFGSCKKTFFLSDYHLQFFKELYGDIFVNVEIVADPIDCNLFKNLNLQRSDNILYAGYIHQGKGANSFFQYVLQNPDKQFSVSGWTSDQIYHILCENISNIDFLGLTKYEDMSKLYNSHKTMFYSPVVREPFCRAVAEAALCGTQIITDKENQIGCLQELNKLGFKEFSRQCSEAPSIFWNKI